MNTTQIAAEAVEKWAIQLRQWLGYDVPRRWIESLTIEVKSAIEKARDTGYAEGVKSERKWAKLNLVSAESRAAHASEQP